MTLNVDKTNVLRAWREADTNGKQMLENLYGKEVFENQNIMDRVKTFEDALKETGRPGVPDFSCLPSDMRKYFEAQYKMVVITEALNEGWEPIGMTIMNVNIMFGLQCPFFFRFRLFGFRDLGCGCGWRVSP